MTFGGVLNGGHDAGGSKRTTAAAKAAGRSGAHTTRQWQRRRCVA